MAVVKPAALAPDTLPRVRGVFLVRPWKTLHVAAKWPRKRGSPKTWNGYWTMRQFSLAGKMAANPEPMSYETARFVTEGSHWLPRDVLTMVAFGKFYEVYLPDGTLCTQASHAAPQPEPPPAEWELAAEAELPNNNHGWNGYTIRQRIAPTSLLVSAAQWRITFTAATATAGANIAEAYIGAGAISGDQYDFADTPTQLLFDGSPGVSIPIGETRASDPATFTLPPGMPLLISCYFGGATSIKDVRILTGWQSFYRFGNTAAVVNPTSYSLYRAALAVTKVETRNP